MTLLEGIAVIIADLNEKTGKRYRPTTRATIKILTARLRDGYTFKDFRRVHDVKCEEWLGTEMSQFLRPQTLYQDAKFEAYLNQDVEKEKSEMMQMWCSKCFKTTKHIDSKCIVCVEE